MKNCKYIVHTLLLYILFIPHILFSQGKLATIEIETVDSINPTCSYVSAPEGCLGRSITDNEYVSGVITKKTNDSVVYTNNVKIKLRGNTSAYEEVKSYKIKLDKKYDLLNRADDAYKHKEWILLNDGTSLNTVVGLKIGEIVGMEWEPKYEFVNFFMNGEFMGCYLLIESVSKGEKRCNVKDSGYVIENDAYWWNADSVYFKTNHQRYTRGFTFKYPDSDDVNDSIINNIKNYINEFEDEAYKEDGNYNDYIDIRTFAAWILVTIF